MPIDEGAVPNGDPQETAGPSGSEVGANEAQRTPEELSNDSSSSEFSIRDELAEQFPLETINVGVSPDDGLPMPMDASDAMALAPKFGPDTLVCVEDDREFVEMFEEDDEPSREDCGRMPESVMAAVYPKEYGPRKSRRGEVIEPPPKASGFAALRSQFDDQGVAVERRRFRPEQVVTKWNTRFAATDDGFLRVMPRRQRCIHYSRMVFANDDPTFKPGEFGHQVLYRNCAARRSVGGALMSVQDQAVYACEHREPRDFVSIERFLDGPDRKRMAAKVEMVSLFNLDSKEK